MSSCGTDPGYDEIDEVSRLVSAKLAAFLRTLRETALRSACTKARTRLR